LTKNRCSHFRGSPLWFRAVALLLCAVWLCTAPVVAVPSPAFAEETVEELTAKKDKLAKEQAALEQQRNESAQTLEEQKKETENLQKRILAKSEEIAVNQQILTKLDGQIQEKETVIAQHEATIASLEGQIDEQYELLRQRLRAISKKAAGTSALELILSSDTYKDYLINSKVSQRVSEHDQALMDALDENIRVTEEARTQTVAAKAELETDRNKQKATQSELESARSSLQTLYTDAEALETEMAKNVEYLDEQIAKLDEQQSSLQSTIDDVMARLEAEKEKEEEDSSSSPSTPSGPVGIMTWPSPTCRVITSSFKYRPQFGRWHKGLDIACYGDAEGEPIVAAADGTVVYANRYNNWGGGYGLYLMIDHGYNSSGQRILTVYAHCSQVTAYEGLKVKAGDTVGYVGNTGNSFGAHLHFEVQVNGTAVDPISNGYLSTSGIHILG